MAERGTFEIQRQIERLQAVSTLPRDVAPDVADVLQRELEVQIKAGRAPDGSTWAPRKEDGGKPLVHAAEKLAVVPIGSTIFARIKGPEARHHKGIAKGGVTRQILPTTELPQPLVRAIDEVIADRFARTMETK